MLRKIRVGIDLDNVLNDLNVKWIERYNNDYNDYLKPQQVNSWFIHRYTKNGFGIYNYLKDTDLLEELEPTKDSKMYLELLNKLDYPKFELFVVTATDYNNIKNKIDWINKYFKGVFSSSNIIMTKRKELINVDILVDDAAHNLVSFPNHKILFKQPWSETHLLNGINYKTANDWSDVYNYITLIGENLISKGGD